MIQNPPKQHKVIILIDKKGSSLCKNYTLTKKTRTEPKPLILYACLRLTETKRKSFFPQIKGEKKINKSKTQETKQKTKGAKRITASSCKIRTAEIHEDLLWDIECGWNWKSESMEDRGFRV